jgi:RNA polymerase sigma-54 factor
MALEQKLNLKMAQRLMMTPQLQQAIKLLQYPKLELQDVITQELTDNPILEEVQEEPQSTEQAEAGEAESAEAQTPEKEREVEQEVAMKDSFDPGDYEVYFQEYLDYGYQPRQTEFRELPQTENFLTKRISLPEHLLWQLSETNADEHTRDISRAIIGNLNGDGYLTATLQEIMAMGDYSEEDTKGALAIVQSLDPIGVGARDLKECLLLQLSHLNLKDSPVVGIVEHHLDLIRRHRYDELAKKLGCPLDTIQFYVDIIKKLDPKPGLKYSAEGSYYVVPDVFVIKVDDDYTILLNEEGLPKLRVNAAYRRLLSAKDGSTSEEARQFVSEKMKSALWLIRSLEQRQKTIYKVAESIVKHQRAFLDKGIEYLKPLVLKNIAEDINMHESTVSRVVTNKYMHTPRGLFEMKYFFHSGITSNYGADVSSLTVKQKIKKTIEEENPRKPVSDAKIVQKLREEGLDIARRTVAKYREEMKIPSSTYRKKIFSK